MTELVQRITVESRFTPPIVIDQPFEDTNAPPNPLLVLLKPKITLTTAFGDSVTAPYGDPVESLWPQIRLTLAALVMVALFWKVSR